MSWDNSLFCTEPSSDPHSGNVCVVSRLMLENHSVLPSQPQIETKIISFLFWKSIYLYFFLFRIISKNFSGNEMILFCFWFREDNTPVWFGTFFFFFFNNNMLKLKPPKAVPKGKMSLLQFNFTRTLRSGDFYWNKDLLKLNTSVKCCSLDEPKFPYRHKIIMNISD